MSSKRNVYGEGNYQASRVYNKATKKFVESGRVEEAARDAAPKSAAEAEDMKRAEEAALLHAKEQDPAGDADQMKDSEDSNPDDSSNVPGRNDTEQPRPRGRSRQH